MIPNFNVIVHLRVIRVELRKALFKFCDGSLLLIVESLTEERFGNLRLGLVSFFLEFFDLLKFISQRFVTWVQFDGFFNLDDSIFVLMQLGKGLGSEIISLDSFLIKFKSLPAINQSLFVVATLKTDYRNI